MTGHGPGRSYDFGHGHHQHVNDPMPHLRGTDE